MKLKKNLDFYIWLFMTILIIAGITGFTTKNYQLSFPIIVGIIFCLGLLRRNKYHDYE